MLQKPISSYFSNRKRIGDNKFSQEKVFLAEKDRKDNCILSNSVDLRVGEGGMRGRSITKICKFLKKAPLSPVKNSVELTEAEILSRPADSAVLSSSVSREGLEVPENYRDKVNVASDFGNITLHLPKESSKSSIHAKNAKEGVPQFNLIVLNCSSPSKKSAPSNNDISKGESTVTSNKPKAYQQYSDLTQTKQGNLPLPYHYRYLFEIFKCVDLVCAMFFNRKEIITFKKLRGIVQKVLRKSFSESHLSQIKHLYPEAYEFTQTKMRNFGSTSKQDYYQLVISPSFYTTLKMECMNEQKDTISLTQILISRQQSFHFRLLRSVKDIHANFLASLNIQMNFLKEGIVRWHPEFVLENCPEIEKADLPQPPGIEKYSSAKDMLSTARNLFHSEKPEDYQHDDSFLETQKHIKSIKQQPANILNRIPITLVEKIRAKQNLGGIKKVVTNEIKNSEIIKYNRLPILLSQLRNIFITEKKNVLPLEVVLNKILFSFRTEMARDELELYIKSLIEKSDGSLSLHQIRHMTYLKMDRTLDLKHIIRKLRH